MSNVFISYRRDDAGSEAILLRDAVRREYGEKSVFMDTSSLQAGSVWSDEIKAGLSTADLVIVVIGPEWLRSGTSEWGMRRIDKEDDWVRQELTLAFRENKRVIPVLVRDARMPPPDVLPETLKALPGRQDISLRRDYWHHDVKLLLAQIPASLRKTDAGYTDLSPYPRNSPEGPETISDDKLKRILEHELQRWKRVVSPLPEKPDDVRIELFRTFKFKTFVDAVQFMNLLAPGCDIAMHHPRWENVWKTLKVYLTTWDIGHRISDRDLQLARYFDRAYEEFAGASRKKSTDDPAAASGC
jgi:pterin-4a-carbinolamine dehydratase